MAARPPFHGRAGRPGLTGWIFTGYGLRALTRVCEQEEAMSWIVWAIGGLLIYLGFNALVLGLIWRANSPIEGPARPE